MSKSKLRVKTQTTTSFEADGYLYTAVKIKDLDVMVFGVMFSVPIFHYMDYICLN